MQCEKTLLKWMVTNKLVYYIIYYIYTHTYLITYDIISYIYIVNQNFELWKLWLFLNFKLSRGLKHKFFYKWKVLLFGFEVSILYANIYYVYTVS